MWAGCNGFVDINSDAGKKHNPCNPWKYTMNKLISFLALSFVASAAMAGPACNVPKDKWMSEADFKTKIEGQGYKIKTFKVSKGQCYEIYGFDKDGKKVEIYYDPATAAPLESK